MMRSVSTLPLLFYLAALIFTAGAGQPGDSTQTKAEFVHPRIQEFGEIVRLPDATEQPRDDSRLCIDVTSATPAADQVNPGLQKVARFVNIYAGAGQEPAGAQFVVVLHGGATLTGLNDSAYGDRFGTDSNPNLPLIAKLKAAGVEFLVCGQSLAHSRATADQLVPEVGVAVSALTANVNRQQDGWVRVPLD